MICYGLISPSIDTKNMQSNGFPRSISIDLFTLPSSSSSSSSSSCLPFVSTELDKGPPTSTSLLEGSWIHFVLSGATKYSPEILSLQIQERLRENTGNLFLYLVAVLLFLLPLSLSYTPTEHSEACKRSHIRPWAREEYNCDNAEEARHCGRKKSFAFAYTLEPCS